MCEKKTKQPLPYSLKLDILWLKLKQTKKVKMDLCYRPFLSHITPLITASIHDQIWYRITVALLTVSQAQHFFRFKQYEIIPV